jgi:polyisoprenoid-binding protein YceI
MNKTITLFSSIALAVVIASCGNEQKPAEETTTSTEVTGEETAYTINTDSTSHVLWKGVMLGVKEHTGTANFTGGKLTAKGNQLTGGSFTVDMKSIKVTDKNYDEKSGYGVNKFLGHIASADFFDVDNNPTATFTITSVNGNEATGTLNVRGKENTETVKDITVTEANGTITAKGVLTFDRKKYDVAFDTGAKDMVISNDVALEITLTGKK